MYKVSLIVLALFLMGPVSFAGSISDLVSGNLELSKEIQKDIEGLSKIVKTSKVSTVEERQAFHKKIKKALKPIDKKFKKLSKTHKKINKGLDLTKGITDKATLQSDLEEALGKAKDYYLEGYAELPDEQEKEYIHAIKQSVKQYGKSIDRLKEYNQYLSKLKKQLEKSE